MAPTDKSLRAAYERGLEGIGYAKLGLDDQVRDFIAAGGDVNARDGNGMTALHHAVAHGARPCIRVLVASGKCDYLIQDNRGRYASEIAIQWARDYAVARLLAKHQVRQAFERGVPAYVPFSPAPGP